MCSVASRVYLFLIFHWTVPLVYHSLQPLRSCQAGVVPPHVDTELEWLAQVWQACFSSVASLEQRLGETVQQLWRGLDTSPFQFNLINPSSAEFRCISFSKPTLQQASREVNPSDFCSHSKADALKCELSQLLSQRVSLDVEFGCVYYIRLLAVKIINLYLYNTCQALQSFRFVLIQCCPFSLEHPSKSPVLKAWCCGTKWNLQGVCGGRGVVDRAQVIGNVPLKGHLDLSSSHLCLFAAMK